LWIYWVPFFVVPNGPDIHLGSLGVATAIAYFVWSRSKRVPATLISLVLLGAAAAYGVGFTAGVLSGPALFPAKPNQGLLLGFFFTGPAGAMLGGFVAWFTQAKLACATAR
jgi:hypothetical protein